MKTGGSVTSAKAGMYAVECSKSHPICESEVTAGLKSFYKNVVFFLSKYESHLDER